MNIVSLTITSFALAFGVFSAGIRTVSVNGTISYTSTLSLARISATITNGFEDDDMDKSLEDINATRAVVVDNFDASYNITENFEFVSGNAGAFISENRWNIGSMYFNPSPNVVPSNVTPTGEQISATIAINLAISNYTTFPISVTITTLQYLTNIWVKIKTKDQNPSKILFCNLKRKIMFFYFLLSVKD